MLGKLIKYDLRFGFKQYMFMAALTLALILGGVIGIAVGNDTIAQLFIVFAVLATIAFFVMYAVISVMHLQKTLRSRESYLTHTLPVTGNQLMFSKCVTIVLWGIFTTALVTLYWFIAVDRMTLASQGTSFAMMWQTLSDTVGAEAIKAIQKGMWEIAGLTILSFIEKVTLILLCVNIANMPVFKERNLGVVMGIVAFIVVSTAVSWITLGAIAVTTSSVAIPQGTMSVDMLDIGKVSAIISSISLITAIISVIFSIASYFTSVYLINKQKSI